MPFLAKQALTTKLSPETKKRTFFFFFLAAARENAAALAWSTSGPVSSTTKRVGSVLMSCEEKGFRGSQTHRNFKKKDFLFKIVVI